jgi:hypothetical protein
MGDELPGKSTAMKPVTRNDKDLVVWQKGMTFAEIAYLIT